MLTTLISVPQPTQSGVLPPMSAAELLAAKEWFIRRFIQSRPGRNFALKMHGLMTGPPLQLRVRKRNAAYDFTFQPTIEGLEVVPITDESRWVYGVIRQTKHGFQFCTLPEVSNHG